MATITCPTCGTADALQTYEVGNSPLRLGLATPHGASSATLSAFAGRKSLLSPGDIVTVATHDAGDIQRALNSGVLVETEPEEEPEGDGGEGEGGGGGGEE